MPIDFFRLLDDRDWVPMPIDSVGPQYFLGGEAASADAGMWRSTTFDPTFNMVGVRCDPNTVVHSRQRAERELVIVFGGSCDVTTDGVESRAVGPGQFWISDPDTAYTLTTGPQGVTYTVSRPGPETLPR